MPWQGLVCETQGWHLKRLLTFTKNRLCNRPHRPRDPLLRDYMTAIGYTWPDPPPRATSSSRVESDGDSESSSDDMEESEESEEREDDVVMVVGSNEGGTP